MFDSRLYEVLKTHAVKNMKLICLMRDITNYPSDAIKTIVYSVA